MGIGWDDVKTALNVSTVNPAFFLDQRSKSNDNNNRDSTLRQDGENAWKDDRQTINNEWNLLNPQYGNFARAVAPSEPFETWSHQDIYEALNGHGAVLGVNQGDINSGADGWRRLTDQASTAIQVFRKGVDQDIDEMWKGRARTPRWRRLAPMPTSSRSYRLRSRRSPTAST